MPKKIHIPAMNDLWDEEKNEFVSIKEQTLVVEHSLLSISKWEQKWKKSFISTEEKTFEELKDYIRCMTINQVNERVYDVLPYSVYKEVEDYISDPMTATTFTDYSKEQKQEIITAELLYYSMISYGIPIEFEKRHVNQLIALIRVFTIKNGVSKKMSASEAAMLQRSINEKRRNSSRRR